MSTATFVEHLHKYEVDGVSIPSVTQVLTLAGISDVSGIPAHILERAGAIGTAVHQATELLDHDDLELDSLDPLIVGYVTAYQRFRSEHEFIPELIEYRTVGEYAGHKYGMCVDRAGKLDGQYCVMDIKTSSKPRPEWAIQTMAYVLGLSDHPNYQQSHRAAIHLAKDGSYSIIRFSEVMDEITWGACLNIAEWRLRNGAKIK